VRPASAFVPPQSPAATNSLGALGTLGAAASMPSGAAEPLVGVPGGTVGADALQNIPAVQGGSSSGSAQPVRGGGGGGLTDAQQFAQNANTIEKLQGQIDGLEKSIAANEHAATSAERAYANSPGSFFIEAVADAERSVTDARLRIEQVDQALKDAQKSGPADQAVYDSLSAEREHAKEVVDAAETDLSRARAEEAEHKEVVAKAKDLKDKAEQERADAQQSKQDLKDAKQEQQRLKSKNRDLDDAMSPTEKARAEKDRARLKRDEDRRNEIAKRLADAAKRREERNEQRSDYGPTQLAKARRAQNRANKLAAKAAKHLKVGTSPNFSKKARKSALAKAKRAIQQAISAKRAQITALKKALKKKGLSDEEIKKELNKDDGLHEQLASLLGTAEEIEQAEDDLENEGQESQAESPTEDPCARRCDCSIPDCYPPAWCVCWRERRPEGGEPGGQGGGAPEPRGTPKQIGKAQEYAKDSGGGGGQDDTDGGGSGGAAPPGTRNGEDAVAPEGGNVYFKASASEDEFGDGDGGAGEGSEDEGGEPRPESKSRAPSGGQADQPEGERDPCQKHADVIAGRRALILWLLQLNIIKRVLVMRITQVDRNPDYMAQVPGLAGARLRSLNVDQVKLQRDLTVAKDVLLQSALSLPVGMLTNVGTMLVGEFAKTTFVPKLVNFVVKLYDAYDNLTSARDVGSQRLREKAEDAYREALDSYFDTLGEALAESVGTSLVWEGTGRRASAARKQALRFLISAESALMRNIREIDKSLPEECRSKRNPHMMEITIAELTEVMKGDLSPAELARRYAPVVEAGDR
jgi:hypothetical protein